MTSEQQGGAPHTLGDRLRHIRKARGWTQEQLAANAGTSQAVIQKIENGKSLRPRRIDVIANVLEVDPAWLMFGGHQPRGLEAAAREVALAWQRLPEPQRVLFRDEIMKAIRAYPARHH